MSERRTKEEWGLLVAMHRGYFPLVDNQPMQNGQGFRRSRALSGPDVTDNGQPMEKAIAHLSKTFPLITPEWTAWSAAVSSGLARQDAGRSPRTCRARVRVSAR